MKPTTSPKKGSALQRAEQALRAFALAYPEAWEDFPWGDRALKVRERMFVCMDEPRLFFLSHASEP